MADHADAVTAADDVEAARELLESSQQLRGDLLEAVGRLDSYIEQLRTVVPADEESGREPA